MKINFLIICVLLSGTVKAQQQEMTILSDSTVNNSYPGNDGFIGTADDIVSTTLTTNNGSAPNTSGSYGYNAFNFGGATNENTLPTGSNAITFVNGTVTVDKNVFNNGGGPIISDLNITSGTEPFPGHGAYTSTITSVNGGSYDPNTHQFSLNVDISFLINGLTSTEPGLVINGIAILSESSGFATGSGNSYFDSILIPRAQANGASSLVFFDGTGTLPNLGFPIRFVIAATVQNFTQINQGISGGWFEPVTSGQGFLIDVDPVNNFIFVAWFTYTDVINQKAIGEPNHRWFTASGNYSGTSANLPLYVTSGGKFNDSQSVITVQDGTMNISFEDCNTGSVQYSIPSANLTGTIPIQRLLPATAILCDNLGIPSDK
jgi:hypothetical protein